MEFGRAIFVLLLICMCTVSGFPFKVISADPAEVF